MSINGFQGHLKASFQESFGTANVASLQAISIVNESIVYEIEVLEEQSLSGRLEGADIHQGFHSITGGIESEVSPDVLVYFLQSVIGKGYTTGSGPYTHTFKTDKSDFDGLSATTPLTFEVYRGGEAGIYSDMCGDQLEFKISSNELMTASMGIVGGSFTTSNNTSPTYRAAPPFTWNQTSCSFQGVAITDIDDMTINISNNLEAVHTLQTSGSPQKIKRTAQQRVTVSGNMLFQVDSYWEAFRTAEEGPMVINFASTANSFKIDMPKFKFTGYAPLIDGTDIIGASFEGVASFQQSSLSAVAFTVVNSYAGADYSYPELSFTLEARLWA